MLSKQRSGRLLAALRQTALREPSELGRWITQSYLAAMDASPAPPPPPSLANWYERYDMAGRAQDPLAVVPYNYA